MSHALSAGARAKALSGDLARVHLSLTPQVPHDSACVCGPTGTTHTVSEWCCQLLPQRGPPTSQCPPTRMGSQVGQRGRRDQDLQQPAGAGSPEESMHPELFQGKRLRAPHCSSPRACVGLGPGLPGASAALSIGAPELVLTVLPGLGSRSFPQQASHFPQFPSSTSPSLLFLDREPPPGIMA